MSLRTPAWPCTSLYITRHHQRCQRCRWSLISLHTHMWLAKSFHINVRPCMPLYVPLCPCMSLHATVHPCISLYVPVRTCMPLYIPVCHCTSLYVTVRPVHPKYRCQVWFSPSSYAHWTVISIPTSSQSAIGSTRRPLTSRITQCCDLAATTGTTSLWQMFAATKPSI